MAEYVEKSERTLYVVYIISMWHGARDDDNEDKKEQDGEQEHIHRSLCATVAPFVWFGFFIWFARFVSVAQVSADSDARWWVWNSFFRLSYAMRVPITKLHWLFPTALLFRHNWSI